MLQSVENPFIQNDQIVTALCPPGKKVVGGGHLVEPVRGRLGASRPLNDGTGWFVYVDRLGANSPAVQARAICATVN